MRASQDFSQIFLPCIFHSRLEDFPIVQHLKGSEVVPQVLHRLDVVLLLCCKDGVKGLQLGGKKHIIAIIEKCSAIF